MFSLARSGSVEGGGTLGSRSESLASLGDPDVSLSGSQFFESPGAKIPVAMALTETVHAKFVGSELAKGQVRVFGSVHVSFPGSAMGALLSAAPPPPLTFSLTQASRLQALIPNKQVLSSASAFASAASHSLAFDPTGLATQLKRLTQARPGAPFYNLEVLRYEVRTPAAPLLLQLSWKRAELDSGAPGELRIDYRLNPANGFSQALLNPTLATTFAGGALDSVSGLPEAEQTPEGRLIWRLTTLSSHGETEGSLKARVHPAPQPPPDNFAPAPTAVTFSIADASMSGAALEVCLFLSVSP